MGSTDVFTQTLAGALNVADPNELADLLRKIMLGTILTPREYDTGVITAVAAVPLQDVAGPTGVPMAALAVMSARVVSSGTAASVGVYHVADSGATPLLPPGGANTAVGIAALSADGLTVLFPNTVTRAVFKFIPRSNTPMTSSWTGGATSGI